MKRFIYLISPKKITRNFYYDLTKVFKTKKVKFFQLRLKKVPKSKIIKIGKEIKKITKKFNVKLIINDSPKIAKKVNADGCHIGQLDPSITYTKKILKKKIIGVTCHGSIKIVNKVIKNNPNYIAVGSFFKSELKPTAKKATTKIIKQIRKKSKIPIVAIGGINDKNYKKLISLGANYIALSSFIWNNPFQKPEIAIRRFK